MRTDFYMIDLPIKADVRCWGCAAGSSTYVIANPVNYQITHMVVKSNRSPFHEYLVPVDLVEETTTVSQIENVCEGTIYLKLDRKSIEELPTTPIQHWLQ